jgi:hypothetical protein
MLDKIEILKEWFLDNFGFQLVFGVLGVVAAIIYFKYVSSNRSWETLITLPVAAFFSGRVRDMSRKILKSEKKISTLEEKLSQKDEELLKLKQKN